MECTIVNIFNFATNEFTQDAMISWTVSLFKSEDAVVRSVGRTFIEELISGSDKLDINSIDDICIKMQKFNIDVLLEIELRNSDTELLLIEDNTYSKEYYEQIDNFRDKLIEEYRSSPIHAVYYKIGTELNAELNFKDRDIQVIDRKKIICIFEKLDNMSKTKPENYLIRSYLEHVKEIEATESA